MAFDDSCFDAANPISQSTGYKAIILALDNSRETGTVKTASTKHFSVEVKAEIGRRLRRPIRSPPAPKTNKMIIQAAPPANEPSPPPVI